eukprot:scaffold363_cov331-Pavlova_lutheri.AAC.116
MASFAWGAGTCGQLGNGRWEDRWCPDRCEWDACEVGVVACGGSQCMATGRDGKLRIWGNTHGLQIEEGKETVERPTVLPMPIQWNLKVTSLAVGWSHFVFSTTDGQVYTCGTGTAGQLGHGQEVQVLHKPSAIPGAVEGMEAVQVGCGLRHTLVLSRQGLVWACGAGKRGQLGLPSVPRQACTLRCVQEIPSGGIRSIRGGGERSACITESGVLFVWGRGWCNTDYDRRVPQVVDSPGIQWQDIQLGWSHAVALDESGKCWAWGSNRYGQLGGEGPDCTQPRQVESDELSARKIVRVAAGSEHSMALSGDGTVFTWGWGEHGQLGLGHTRDSSKPAMVDLPARVDHIACGAGFSLAFTVLQK